MLPVLAFVAAAALGRFPGFAAFLPASLYWGANLATGPAWNNWVGRLVPRRIRPTFFARRNRAWQAAIMAGTVAGGLCLHLGSKDGSVFPVFAALFPAAAMSRIVSTLFLARQSETRPVTENHRSVTPLEFFRRARQGDDGRLLLYMLAVQVAVQIAGPFFTPYMQAGRPIPMDYAGPFLEKHPDLKGFVFLASGNEEDQWVSEIKKLATLFQDTAPQGLERHYEHVSSMKHGMEFHTALFDALTLLYRNWAMPVEANAPSLDSVAHHYASLSERYGYEVVIPEQVLNRLGYLLLKENRKEEAIAVFQKNVETYPDSWNVYDSLGEAYMISGNEKLAEANYTMKPQFLRKVKRKSCTRFH